MRNHSEAGGGPSELGVVVPTGFEPVFKYDYDFAFYF